MHNRVSKLQRLIVSSKLPLKRDAEDRGKAASGESISTCLSFIMAQQAYRYALSVDPRYTDAAFLSYLDEAGFSQDQIGQSKQMLQTVHEAAITANC